MQNFRKIQWIVIENFPDGRTDGRTRVNSKVPIPTKVGGPTSARCNCTGHKLGRTFEKQVGAVIFRAVNYVEPTKTIARDNFLTQQLRQAFEKTWTSGNFLGRNLRGAFEK